MPKPVLTPLQRDAPLDDNQQFNTRWYLYFTLVTAWIQELIVNAVYGKPTLLNLNRMTKVTAAGTIGEAAFKDTDVVLGATGLTHDGRLTMVSATDGTISESTVIDDGTTVYDLTRNLALGVAAALVTTAGRRYIVIKGDTDAGVFEAIGAAADADATLIGLFQVSDTNNNARADKRLALIQVLTQGATAGDRGGRLRFGTKANGGAITAWEDLDNAGRHGFGGNLAPAYPVDVTGDVNTSGVYRVAAAAGVAGALTLNVTTLNITYKNGAGVNESNTFVTGVTLTANAFTGGIRTT